MTRDRTTATVVGVLGGLGLTAVIAIGLSTPPESAAVAARPADEYLVCRDTATQTIVFRSTVPAKRIVHAWMFNYWRFEGPNDIYREQQGQTCFVRRGSNQDAF